MIRYTSRDDVELASKGRHGSTDIREFLAAEPDDSPLYGLVRHRRRNILIKYVPEGTSRVLKGIWYTVRRVYSMLRCNSSLTGPLSTDH